MAHELSFDSNGNAEAFFAMKPAWHGLGTVLDHAPNSADAMIAANLDWQVSKVPLRTDEGADVDGWYATVRRDTGAVLGVVSDKYRIVQNRHAFDFLDGLISDGELRYESAGALKGGRVVWLLARMPSDDEILPGDISRRYVLFSTSHDGSQAIHAIPTSVRVVCANTLRLATSTDKGLIHTGDMKQKLLRAKQYLSQFDEKFTLFRDNARLLATRSFTPEQSREYINALFPEVPAGRSKSNRDNKLIQVRSNFVNARNTLPGMKGTWWQLLNSVTELVDHDRRKDYRQRDSQEARLLSTTDGTGADFKAEAFRLALAMSV